MTTLREAAQQALEALEWFNRYGAEEHGPSLRGAEHALRAALAEQRLTDMEQKMERSIESLKAALAESPDSTKPVAESEPVAWINNQGDLLRHHPESYGREDENWTPLHTAPLNLKDTAVQKRLAAQWGYAPQRKPLTEEEIQAIWTKTFESGSSANTFARAIERAHGIGGQDE